MDGRGWCCDVQSPGAPPVGEVFAEGRGGWEFDGRKLWRLFIKQWQDERQWLVLVSHVLVHSTHTLAADLLLFYFRSDSWMNDLIVTVIATFLYLSLKSFDIFQNCSNCSTICSVLVDGNVHLGWVLFYRRRQTARCSPIGGYGYAPCRGSCCSAQEGEGVA